MWPWIPSGNVTPNLSYLLLCTLFVIKMETQGSKLTFLLRSQLATKGKNLVASNFGHQLIGQYHTIPENPCTIVKYLLKLIVIKEGISIYDHDF